MADTRLTHPARWRALLGLLWEAGRGRVLLYAAAVVAAGALPTVLILLSGELVHAINAVPTAGTGPALRALAWLAAALAALTVASNAAVYLGSVIGGAFSLAVHSRVTRATLGTPGLAPLEDPAFADRLQAIDEAERRGVLRDTARHLFTVVAMRLRGLGAFVVLLGFQWWAPFVLLAAWHLTNRLYESATEKGVTVDMGDGAVQMRRAEYLRSLAVEAPAAKEIRLFGLGHWLVGRYGDAWMRALGAMWASRKANRALTLATVAALALSHALVLGALALAAIRGDLGAAALLVFIQAALATADLGMMLDPQWALAQSLAVSGRVAELEVPADAPPFPAAALPAPRAERGGVALELGGVRFTYRGRGEPTLDGLSLHVPAGQSLAIVGENGAGKSTLIKLLCGLYEPQEGRITMDGAMTPLQARGRIAAIFQDFVRYPLPLRENVAFGNLQLVGDEAALRAALDDAGGGGLIERLAHGWDTVLSREFEGGSDLSGGQWQRVALARALTAVRGGAGLLILDEPTAALDVRAETELFDRFLELTRDVTTILVSHRLSSVRHADRIVVIDGGRVVEDGTHESLMRAGGRYARMYSLQAERFAAEPVLELAEVASA
ncbi:MAG TPA: ABC transporter ATP-binding protein [Longimicrobium sp.]|nr:ABC transporter ATP-binding protein [Longimicrobium sp.]